MAGPDKKTSKYPPETVWVDAVKQFAGEAKVPIAETSFYVDLVHDKDFINNQGQPVKVDGLTRPWLALLTSNSWSQTKRTTFNGSSLRALPSSLLPLGAPISKSSDVSNSMASQLLLARRSTINMFHPSIGGPMSPGLCGKRREVATICSTLAATSSPTHALSLSCSTSSHKPAKETSPVPRPGVRNGQR